MYPSMERTIAQKSGNRGRPEEPQTWNDAHPPVLVPGTTSTSLLATHWEGATAMSGACENWVEFPCLTPYPAMFPGPPESWALRSSRRLPSPGYITSSALALPVTQPRLVRGTIPLPATSIHDPNEPCIHPILQFGNQRLQRARWDVRTPFRLPMPCFQTGLSPHERVEETTWYLQRASIPPLQSLTIWTAAFDRALVIHASRGSGVSVYDILDRVHREFRERLEPRAEDVRDLFGLGLTMLDGRGERLMEDGEILMPENEREGWIWAGLTKSSTTTECWNLHLT